MAIHSYNPNEKEQRIAERFPSVVDSKPTTSRLSRYERGYGSQWPSFRMRYLQANPACVCCKRKADMVDHIRPIRYGGEVFDPANLQSMCNKCHAYKTATDDSKAEENGWIRKF